MVVDPAKVDELIVSYGNNYNQGIKALQSRYKKDLKSGSPFLLLALADLSSRLRDFDNAEGYLQKFHQAKDIPSDRDTLEKLYNVTCMTNKRKGNFAKTVGPDVVRVFETAAKKQKPTGGFDDPFILLFRVAANHHNWKDTQTASKQLRQRYPKDRNYFFLFVACCELAAKSSPPGEQFFKLAMQKTANTMLTKVVENTLSGSDAFERLVDLRQFHLLKQVYQDSGRYADLLEVLENEDGLRASIPGLQTEEIQALKLDSLSHLGEPQRLFDACFQVLCDALERKKDDTIEESARTSAANWLQSWNVWQHLIEALESIQDPAQQVERKTRFEGLVEKVESQESKRFYEIRSALLARLTAATKLKLSYSNACELACHYFEKSSVEPTCFTDLRTVLPYLSERELDSFFEKTRETVEAASTAETHREQYAPLIHHLHLRYLLKISRPEQKSSDEINNYIQECLKLIHLGAEQGQKSIGASFLASIGLVHLAFQEDPNEPKIEHLVQAAYLLNSLGTDMRFPAAQLLAVKLNLYLGLSSLGSFGYHKLKVKNIVVDSLGYHMYARISIQNPLGPGVRIKEYSTMAEELSTVLTKTYTNNVNGEWKKDPIRRWKKNLPQYDAFLDIAEQETKLDQSLTRLVMRVENRRCQRLWGNKYEDNDPPIDKIANLNDGVEYLPAWCIGWKDREHQFFDLVQDGPRIGHSWLAAFILADDTSSIIWGQHSMVPTTVELEQILSADGAEEKLKAETTKDEFKVLEGWRLLRTCARTLLDKAADATSLKKDVEKLSSWLKNNLPTEKDGPQFLGMFLPTLDVLPTTKTLQTVYLTEDFIWNAIQLFLIRLPAVLREDEKRLKKHIDVKTGSSLAVMLMHAMVNISDILAALRTEISRTTRKGVLDALNTELGKNIQSALAEKDIDSVADQYFACAHESVDNCFRVNAAQRKWIWSSSSGQALLAPVWDGKKQ